MISFDRARPRTTSLVGRGRVSSRALARDVDPSADHDNHDPLSPQFTDRSPHGHARHSIGVGDVLVRRQTGATRKPARFDVRAQIVSDLLPHQRWPVVIDAVPAVAQYTLERSPTNLHLSGHIRV